MADDERHTALHDAAVQGSADAIRNLLKGTVHNVNDKGIAGWTALHYASRGGHREAVQALIDSKALVGVKTKMQDTALHLAAEAGHTKVVKSLLDAKAMPSVEDSKGRTPSARSQSDEIKGMLAAHQSVSSSQPLSAAAMHSQMQELTQKIDQLSKDNTKLLEEKDQAAAQEKRLAAELCDVAPLKALVVGCWDFQESDSFPSLPQVRHSCAAIRQALVATGAPPPPFPPPGIPSGFSFSNILTSDNPTLAELQAILAKMQSDEFTRGSSTILVYLGSHTHYDALTKQSYFVVRDTVAHNVGESAVTLTELSRGVSNCRAKRQVVLFDAMRHVKSQGNDIRDHALDELADKCRKALIITACSVNQVAECTPAFPDAQAKSIFATAVVSALLGEFGGDRYKADARVQQMAKDFSARSLVMASQLIEYLNIAMQQQRPVYLNAATALADDFPVSMPP